MSHFEAKRTYEYVKLQSFNKIGWNFYQNINGRILHIFSNMFNKYINFF